MQEHSKLIAGLVAVLLVTSLGLYWWLNRGYGETSPQGYQLAIALFSACNQQSVERLSKVSEMIDSSAAAGELGKAESVWLQDIVAWGMEGDWERANQAVRQLMDDQVKRAAKPSPASSS